MIVVLNGTSSSGKSTLAKALQDVLSRPALLVGIDTFVFALPRRFVNDPVHWSEVFRYEYVEGVIDRIAPAPLGDRLVRGLHRAVAALADDGLDVVVDHVLLSQEWADDLTACLAPYDVLRVGVTCPVEVLDAREAARGDRTLGQARAQHPVVHTFLEYDVVVDTSANTPEECADTVAAAVSPG
ncbi:MAG TPA: AAA family ATPase [Nocardioidaceae bacterium]|nr:AAA family ATPase [Nocardioidaceae bacterium]